MSVTSDTVAQAEAIRARLFDDLASLDVVAAALGRSTRQIRNMIAGGQLRAVQIGNARYVVVSEMRVSLMQHGRLKAKAAPAE